MWSGKKGMTLTELIVVVAILCVVLVPILAVMYSVYESSTVEVDTQAAQQSAREAMDSIMNDLRAYECAQTRVPDDGHNKVLVIKNDLRYDYDSSKGTLTRDNNGSKKEFENITYFNVLETLPTNSGRYDDNDKRLINVEIRSKVGKSRDILTLKNTYRYKVH